MHLSEVTDTPAHEALRRAAADLDAAERRAQPSGMSQALAQLGRCYRGLGACTAAEACLEQALRWSALTGSVDLGVDLLCELGETAACIAEEKAQNDENAAHAARERARDHAFEASRCVARVSDPQWEIKVLLRISDVLDRCGDHDDAAALQSRALRLMVGESSDLPPDAGGAMRLPGMPLSS